jgi:hypothetical protein
MTAEAPVEKMTLEREGTAELTNDPRFFTENVIDKRLAAFEALAIVTEIMASEAVKQCFELSKEFVFREDFPIMGAMQMIGFVLMCTVMFMSTVATAVLSLQLFFTIRLMTAGPTGFDKAASFYVDRRMWIWRERAIFGVKWSLFTFTLSTGFMLCVKFYTEGMEEEERENHHAMRGAGFHRFIATSVFAFFCMLSAGIFYLVKVHQQVFDESYQSVDTCVPGELRSHFLANQGHY